MSCLFELIRFIILIIVFNYCQCGCPEGWIGIKKQLVCMKIYQSPKTWSDANDFCKTVTVGSHLASILSSEEQFGLLKVRGNYPIQRVWIGLFYDTNMTDPVWKWSDSQAWNDTGYKKGAWAPSQPDNLGIENCGVAWLIVGGKFMDLVCDFMEPFVCKLYAWSEWGQWSSCSTTCAEGTRIRARICASSGQCPGSAAGKESCNDRKCPIWTTWTTWSPCTRTCGGGSTTRTRTCENAPGCLGNSTETKICSSDFCPFWTPWSFWDGCSVTCNGGVQHRTRSCNGGDACIGIGNGTQRCNAQRCIEAPCPYMFSRIGNSCFKLLGQAQWSDAYQACLAEGSHLVGNLDDDKMCHLDNLFHFLDYATEKDSFWTSLDTTVNETMNYTNEVRHLAYDLNGLAILNAFKDMQTKDRTPVCEIEIDATSKCFYQWRNYLGQCYKIVSAVPKSFNAAELSCNKNGGHLASIHSKEQLDFLRVLTSDSTLKDGAWIGLNDIEDLNYWQFTDASEVETLINMEEKPECPGGFQLVQAGQCSCWKFIKSPLDYFEAARYCQRISSVLLTIHTADERFKLTENILQQGLGNLWMGYNDISNEGHLRAVDGSRQGFLRFGKNEPTDFLNQDCMYMDSITFRLYSDWCFNRRIFGCRTDVSCVAPAKDEEYPTLGAVEKAVALAMKTLGNFLLIATLSALLAVFISMRSFGLERLLQMSEEISLLIANIVLVSAADNYGNDVGCKAVAAVLHFTYFVHFAFLLLETCQTYAIVTCVVLSGGFMRKWVYLLIGWGGSAVVCGLTAAFLINDYVTPIMCFLNARGPAMGPVMGPIIVMIILSLIIVEAAGMGEDLYPKVPGFDETQMLSCKISQKGLLFIIPLSASAWLLQLIAISAQNLGMFTMAFGINISLSVAFVVFHGASHAEVRKILKRIWIRMKGCCRKPVVEEGSFEENYHNHDYNLWDTGHEHGS